MAMSWPTFPKRMREYSLEREAMFRHYLADYNYDDTNLVTEANRSKLFKWVFDVMEEFGMSYDTIELAFRIFDVYNGRKGGLQRRDIQTISIACMLLACKVSATHRETEMPLLANFCYCSAGASSEDAVLAHEELIFIELQFEVSVPTIISFVHDIFESFSFITKEERRAIVSESIKTCLRVSLYPNLLRIALCDLAPASISFAVVTLKMRRPLTWPTWIVEKTSEESIANALSEIVKTIYSHTEDNDAFGEFKSSTVTKCYDSVPLPRMPFFDPNYSPNPKRQKYS